MYELSFWHNKTLSC